MSKLTSTVTVFILVFGVAAEHASASSLTGSRIRATSGPVTVVNDEFLESSGVVNDLSTLLPTLTFPGVGQTVQDTGGNISLRGLGTNRTLVLFNGKRRPSGSAYFRNETIPAGLVERVEVLRDGASGMYGSDAVAGVVSFITTQPKDWEYTVFATEDAGDIVNPATTVAMA